MAHDMYLTFDEYKDFGGTVDAAAWPPLEYACRKRIDRLTDSRVQNMAEIPGAVKLCVFVLADADAAAKQMNAIAADMLYGELDDYGVPLLYRGVR